MSGRGASAVRASQPQPKRLRDRSWRCFVIACGSLFISRFFLPAESADDGETLWIAAAWLATAALAGWIAWREGRFHWKLGWPEAAVACLAGAQVVSALHLLWNSSGNCRAAVNMLWEWVGIVVAFALLRIVGRDADGRKQLVGLLITSGIVLAGLGVWQRYVWYPQIQADYREWEQLSHDPAAQQGAGRRRLEELRRSLGPEWLGLGGTAQAALRQRVLDSLEPFGRFALANTFGGFLACVLVLLAGCWRWTGRMSRAGGAVLAVLITTALLLTRSRTAWLAALCGLVYVGAVRWSQTNASSSRRTLVLRLVLAGLAIVPLGALAIAFGAIDRQDLVEAPKSVLYRVQYWTATWRVIREHPWLGVGPGNFRQHYLQYKLPEASEEISDPHNLVLDVWATGGVLALAAIVWLGVLAVRAGMQPLRAGRPGAQQPAGGELPIGSTTLAGLAAMAAVFGAACLFAVRFDWQLLWLAAGWVAAAAIVERGLLDRLTDAAMYTTAAVGAGLVLAIHLLTSGGISMPAVCLLLLALVFVMGEAEDRPPAGRSSPRAATAIIALSIAGLLGLVLTALSPAAIASLEMAGGSAALLIDGRPDRAARLFAKAAESDPLDPDPLRELAYAEVALWRRGGSRSLEHFQAAIDAGHEAIRRDPVNPHLRRLLGELWMQRARLNRDAVAARRAVDALQAAIHRYPNSSALHAELAHAWQAAGEPRHAAQAAARALALDHINDEAQHYDKTFTADQRRLLRELTAGEDQATGLH